MEKPVILILDGAQHAAVRAALALYIQKDMGDPAYRPNNIHNIATGLDDDAPGEVISLDQDALEALAATIRRGAMPGDILSAVVGADELAKTVEQLHHEIAAGIEAAQGVVDNWAEGDLAGAVNGLEDWAANAADLVPDDILAAYDGDDEEEDEEEEDEDDAAHLAKGDA